jgi:anaerobic magnesium-protoporphyrin IX monomethyl ester cyclase
MNPPLGLPILAGVLNRAGHQCEVTDLEALAVTPERLKMTFQKQEKNWPDVIGFTALTASARGAGDSIEALREAGFKGLIVLGGVHATLFPNEALGVGADLVVTGECEGNIVELLETNARGIQQGIPAPIDSIPSPDWAHHNPSPTFYEGNAPHLQKPEAITMWSRGCPHSCIMCGNTIFHQQAIRRRSPESIESELLLLKNTYHAKSLFVYDDEFVGLPVPDGWMAELADRIGPLGFTWKGQGRCSEKHITPELMRDVYRSGCRVMMWGVESFSENVLNAMKKGTSQADIWHTLEISKAAGIKNWLFMMIGNYKETPEDLQITADFLGRAYNAGLVDYRQTTVVTAMPGTELYDIQHREGWYEPIPAQGPLMAQIYQSTPWLTKQDIQHWYTEFEKVCPVNQFGRAA